MVEIEFAHGEPRSGLEGFEPGSGGSRGRGFDMLAARDEDAALQVPGVADDECILEFLGLQDLLGLLQVFEGGLGPALDEEGMSGDTTLPAVVASYLSFRVGRARSLAAGEDECPDPAFLEKIDSVIKSFPQNRGGLVVPGRSPEDDRAVRATPVVAESEAVNREGLPREVEKQGSHEPEQEAPEIEAPVSSLSLLTGRACAFLPGPLSRPLKGRACGRSVRGSRGISHDDRQYSTPD